MTQLPAGEVRYTIADASDSTATFVHYARTSATLADVRAAALAEWGRVEAITRGAILYFTVLYATVVQDAPAPAGAVRERRGVFVFATDADDQYYVLTLPTLRDDLADEFGVIDITQPAVVDLAAAIISGPWCSPFGHNITELLSAHYEFMP